MDFVRGGDTFFAKYEPVGQYGWGVLVDTAVACSTSCKLKPGIM